MTKWSAYSDSPYLSAGDFEPGEEKQATITAIRDELVGRERQRRPVAYFREQHVKPLVLNATNRKKLTASCGPTTEDCIGAFVTLHVIETEFAGEPVEGIRIKAVSPPAREPAGPPKAPLPKKEGAFAPNARSRGKKTVSEEMDDEVPF